MLRKMTKNLKLHQYMVPRFNQTESDSTKKCLKSWKLDMKPFGKLKVNVQDCSIRVTTADPMKFENKMMVDLYKDDASCATKMPTVHADGDVRIEDVEPGSHIEIAAPVAVNFDIRIGGSGNAEVSSIESDQVKVTTAKGDISLSSIKAMNIDAQSAAGNITTSKSLHGNISLNADGGRIDTGRVQGPVIELNSHGDVTTTDVYGEEVMVNSAEGDLLMKSVHGACDLNAETGDIFVGVASDKAHMSAPEGDVDVFLSKHTDVFVHTNGGRVKLRNAHDNPAKIHLEACGIAMADDERLGATRVMERAIGPGTHMIANLHGGGPPVVVKCNVGSVEITSMSWIERVLQYDRKKKDKSSSS